MNPDDVVAFLRTSSEAEIAAAVDEIGVGVVLDVVFDGMADRFGVKPGRLPGVLVVELEHGGQAHRRGVRLTDGGASVDLEPAEARATLKTTLVRFLRVAVGAQDPKRLVVTGRLRLSGDVLWAATTLASLKS